MGAIRAPRGATSAAYVLDEAAERENKEAVARYAAEQKARQEANARPKKRAATFRAVTNAHLTEGATEVADQEFLGRGDVKAVELHGVTKVGESAFDWCRNLETVNMPQLAHVGARAFRGCGKLGRGGGIKNDTLLYCIFILHSFLV